MIGPESVYLEGVRYIGKPVDLYQHLHILARDRGPPNINIIGKRGVLTIGVVRSSPIHLSTCSPFLPKAIPGDRPPPLPPTALAQIGPHPGGRSDLIHGCLGGDWTFRIMIEFVDRKSLSFAHLER